MLESTAKSSALTENLDAYRARIDTIGPALKIPSSAPAPHNKRLSDSSVRRSITPLLAPSAAQNAEDSPLPSHRPGQNQIGDVFEHAMHEHQQAGSHENQQNRSGIRRDLIAQLNGADLEMRLCRMHAS